MNMPNVMEATQENILSEGAQETLGYLQALVGPENSQDQANLLNTIAKFKADVLNNWANITQTDKVTAIQKFLQDIVKLSQTDGNSGVKGVLRIVKVDGLLNSPVISSEIFSAAVTAASEGLDDASQDYMKGYATNLFKIEN